ncbi:hypothetical protein BJY04DRAFT_18650 [Aspergillus karnatakaensis]|uniref:uncharacterized protein n=1 Tax=Aspergillus karnatakaensis TaxID=1810916 RepID=UPI003CCCB648
MAILLCHAVVGWMEHPLAIAPAPRPAPREWAGEGCEFRSEIGFGPGDYWGPFGGLRTSVRSHSFELPLCTRVS